ncbi:platelet endothelial cell adhesion molecule isoform X3 [Echeneis naucrates]|uniref:platelet endothelial cell adhesion molecule isoform X3 n=1 Tax=Echeneis naucrates TaxID=173247 RepID=UPI0011139145|nr:platelet endothelial cell adhesion molecule-like isoform X3 [Echeneis naucrates]
MGLLLLFTSALLSSYFHRGDMADMSQFFTIRDVILSFEPSANVTRGTNVTVRCKAVVSSYKQEPLTCQYTLYEGNTQVYNMTSSTSEDLLYLLPNTRVSNTGKYMCKINIKGKESRSESKKLTVTGLSKPELHINKDVVNEEDEVTARCTAPSETGSFYFRFYRDSEVILEEQGSSNHYEAKFRLRKTGNTTIQCEYGVAILSLTIWSNKSNTVNISVKELFSPPVLDIDPQLKIYEGDTIRITCTNRNSLDSSEKANLYLSHGDKLLNRGETEINHSMVALAKDPREFECRQEVRKVVKVTTKTISVTELFSAPILTMSPAEVFEKEYLTLTCKSASYASERIHGGELTYTLEPSNRLLSSRKPGVFSGMVGSDSFSCTCAAQAKGIVKHSETLTVHPKVSVSTPEISVKGQAVLGRPINIRCQSASGSFPISYTLIKEKDLLRTTTVKLPTEEAVFTVIITRPEELKTYTCQAKNNPNNAKASERLNAAVIEPLSDLTLTVKPKASDILEEEVLMLTCIAKGTPPVTFNVYHIGKEEPVHTYISEQNYTNYVVPKLSKKHSGKYYCEAVNNAKNIIRSEKVTIEVRLALWKKALIGGICLLVVSVLVVICVVYFKSKKGAASLFEGMEGRVTNGTKDSMASLPADIS